MMMMSPIGHLLPPRPEPERERSGRVSTGSYLRLLPAAGFGHECG